MAILAKPSRSYRDVEHDSAGVGSVGQYGASIKTYRPSYAETHFKRQAMLDANPTSAFSPLPPALANFGRKRDKEQTLAGRRAEMDHILQPEYKTGPGDGDDASVAGAGAGGPSRPGLLGSGRTAGGFAARAKAKGHDVGLGIRPTPSIGSFKAPTSARAGVYVDANGKLHDTEFDPFAGVSAMSRRKSRRRSAFGGGGQRGSGSSSSSASDSGEDAPRPRAPSRPSVDGQAYRSGNGAQGHGHGSAHGHARRDSHDEAERDELEIRRRLEAERRRLDDVSGLAAARRRSAIGERAALRTPSLRSADDRSLHSVDKDKGRSRSSQGYHVLSPLSPTFAGGSGTGSSYTSRTLPTTVEADDAEKHSESTGDEWADARGEAHTDASDTNGHQADTDGHKADTNGHKADIKGHEADTNSHEAETKPRLAASLMPPPPTPPPKPTPERPRQTVEIAPDGARRITGFDAPRTPVLPDAAQLRVPDSARSASSRTSSDRPRPAERPREQLFPETPAQAKRREEKARKAAGVGLGNGVGRVGGLTSRVGSLAIDPGMALSSSGRGRILPEIEIVEDDDPRIVFPPHGAQTRVQTTHDHVIRAPFAHAIHAQSGAAGAGGSGLSRVASPTSGAPPKALSGRSIPAGSDSKAPSTIIDEVGGGYLPSRWANGDRELRQTGESKDRYRPREWGGKHGDLAGKSEEWKPNVKEAVKRNVKDVAVNARFSMFRAKKKILRKAEI
ncbi:hypothetical protein Q5752_006119 [Cryptotrichosporon argae]